MFESAVRSCVIGSGSERRWQTGPQDVSNLAYDSLYVARIRILRKSAAYAMQESSTE